MTSFRISPNYDPNYKENCVRCQGKGHMDFVGVASDGENWSITSSPMTTVCPQCRGKKQVMADYKTEEIED